MHAIETPRLILRPWLSKDLADFIRMNSNPQVMEYMLGPLKAEQSQIWSQKIQEHFEEYGFGPYSCILKDTLQYIGMVGLNKCSPEEKLPFAPCIEILWRLLPEYWGKGYAIEAAKAVLDAGFNTFSLSEIVAFTPTLNTRSQRVMEKIDMQRDSAEDFHHPKLPMDHPLSLHVLYKIQREDFLQSKV